MVKMTKPKVAVLAIDYPPKIGGGPTRALMVTQALKNASFDVTVFVGGTTGLKSNEKTGIKVHSISFLPKDAFGFVPRFFRYILFSIESFFALLMNPEFDAIVVCGPHPFADFPATLFGYVVKIPSILDLSDIWPEAIYFKRFEGFFKLPGMKINKFVFSKHRGYIFMNEALDQFSNKYYDLPDRPSAIVRNITDVDLFVPFDMEHDNSNRCQNPKPCTVLYHGVAGPYQGLSQIVAIARELKSNPEIKFCIRAYGVDLDKVRSESIGLGLNISFLERMDDECLRKTISSSSLGLVVASKISKIYLWGLMPTKLSEYLSCGVPVVVPKGSAAERIVVKNQAGISVDFECPVESAKIISEYLSSSKLSEARVNARNLAVREFSLQNASVLIKKLVIKCLRERRNYSPTNININS
jgi:glycosyltransferase involved in cell wall biosynthesis